MMVWRYTAIDLQTPSESRRGEVTGDTASEVRASLRRIGLQVIELKPVRSTRFGSSASIPLWTSIEDLIYRHLRQRRRSERCEIYDSLATMLESGIPLLEAVQSICGEADGSSARWLTRRRSMLIELRERLKAGAALDEAMKNHPSWFDGIEIAMVSAGQHGGELPRVLRSMAEQHERSGELTQKFTAALAYPAIITLIGLGVVIFLSVKTLPDLTGILMDAGIEVPALTANVMAIGQVLAGNWLLILLIAFLLILTAAIAPGLRNRYVPVASSEKRFTFKPQVWRRMCVAGLSLRLSALIRTGVPVVDALRVLSPTVGDRYLQHRLNDAADRVERGEEMSAALTDGTWFDEEYRRLLDIGQATGELHVLLERIGHRYQRQAQRLIDRLAALLEPCVMLALAVLVGIVVMAAILPMIRLQEVL